MKEALKEFIESLPEGGTGLRFFEMPTGSGKTYGTKEFMRAVFVGWKVPVAGHDHRGFVGIVDVELCLNRKGEKVKR